MKADTRFKLKPKDLLMMDNYRLLHGRTAYDANEGNRFLQGTDTKMKDGFQNNEAMCKETFNGCGLNGKEGIKQFKSGTEDVINAQNKFYLYSHDQ